jgi:tetratricopeptide (TPR) repeat protein
VQRFQEAVDLTPEGHPDQARYLHDLAMSFSDRYRRLGDLGDLKASLHKRKEVVELTPEGHPDRAGCLQNLGVSFSDQYKRLGHLDDLEASMQKFQEALDLTPKGHPERVGRLQNLGVSLSDRFRRLGGLDDLEASVQRYQEAVDHTPEGHPGKAQCLHDLAMAFHDRYKRLGYLDDLEASLQKRQEVVKLTPEGHPERAGRLQNLGVSFSDRYKRLGDLDDLEASVQNFQEAVDLTPEGHPDRVKCLHDLAVSLSDRYKRLGVLGDLEISVQRFQEAVDLTLEGDPDQARYLDDLALSFSDRYRRLGDLDDLEASMQKRQEAVELTPEGHPERAGRLQNLGVSFSDRYKRLGHLDDLEASMQTFQEAVNLTPEGHPYRAQSLHALAVSFIDRYLMFRVSADLKAIHTHYITSFKQINFSPEASWKAALTWASFSEQFQPSDCSTAYSAAFHLLPDILWIGHAIPVRHDAIRRLDIGQATSRATRICITLSSLPSAVELLEQGLAITFQQMHQLKTDVDRLGPDQAETFNKLSSKLYSGTCTDPMKVANERKTLLEEIRQQPDLNYFLLPKPYHTLRHASQGGPVVILNSHTNSCDAIIILDPISDPVHVPLPNVTLDLLASQRTILKELLGYCNVRIRGESESTRLFGHRELFTSKTPEECFADMLTWLWTHIVTNVYQVLELVSASLILLVYINIYCSNSITSTMAGCGGCQLVHLQDCLCTQALQLINSSIHTQQHWGLFLMLMPRNHLALHLNVVLLE